MNRRVPHGGFSLSKNLLLLKPYCEIHRQPFQNRTILCFALNLPPLSKVRCCRPKKFGRLPEGLPHQPLQNRTIPRKALSPLPFNERFASFAKCSKSPTHLPLNERSVCFASLPRQPLVSLRPAATAICAVASCNGFVWLSLCILA